MTKKKSGHSTAFKTANRGYMSKLLKLLGFSDRSTGGEYDKTAVLLHKQGTGKNRCTITQTGRTSVAIARVDKTNRKVDGFITVKGNVDAVPSHAHEQAHNGAKAQAWWSMKKMLASGKLAVPSHLVMQGIVGEASKDYELRIYGAAVDLPDSAVPSHLQPTIMQIDGFKVTVDKFAGASHCNRCHKFRSECKCA